MSFSIKSYGEPSSGRRFISCVQTDWHEEANSRFFVTYPRAKKLVQLLTKHICVCTVCRPLVRTGKYNRMLQPMADFIIGSDLEVQSINCLYRVCSCNHQGACFRIPSRGILVRLLQTMSGSFKTRNCKWLRYFSLLAHQEQYYKLKETSRCTYY
jgi:hypothetical protein